jgi:hypothetical protein
MVQECQINKERIQESTPECAWYELGGIRFLSLHETLCKETFLLSKKGIGVTCDEIYVFGNSYIDYTSYK